MDNGKRELVEDLLERYTQEDAPDSVKSELALLLSPYNDGVALLRELAKTSLENARRALSLIDSELFYSDREQLQQELYLLEDEAEAAILRATADAATLEAHMTLCVLLPLEEATTERRRRVLALTLVEDSPERVAMLLGDYTPRYDTIAFWGHFRRNLFFRLKNRSPALAITMLHWPQDAHDWLLELSVAPDTNTVVLRELITHVVSMDFPIDLPLADTRQLIDAIARRDIAERTDLLCLIARSGSRPIDDRPVALERLMAVGKSLPESELKRLVEAIRKEGVSYLRAADRRRVLNRLAHFARSAHPEIRHEIRMLRAIALLIHLRPRRLARAREWAPAYGKRFQKRVETLLEERQRLIKCAAALQSWRGSQLP